MWQCAVLRALLCGVAFCDPEQLRGRALSIRAQSYCQGGIKFQRNKAIQMARRL